MIMSNRTLYLVGLLGIILICSTLTVVMALTGHVDLAVDSFQYGVIGAFLWAFLKESSNQ
jgi:hypothetical protein